MKGCGFGPQEEDTCCATSRIFGATRSTRPTGLIGEVDDLYFDDEDWAIRYLVVDTGGWLSGRKVLISPVAIGHPDWMARLLAGLPHEGAGGTQPGHRHPNDRCHASTKRRISDITGTRTTGEAQGLWGMGAYPGSLTTEGRVEEDNEGQTDFTGAHF